MTRVVLRLALLALLFTPERRRHRIRGRAHRANSISTFCPCPGRHPSALALPSEAPATPMCSAGRDPFLSSFMGYGRNMTTASRSIAKFRPRGLIAAWFPPCST